ncbi:MAG: Maf family protein [Planctomycetota bacterium]
MSNLPRAALPTGEPLILASGSPRRKELLTAAGYTFEVLPASDEAECGMCSRETAPEMVARLAYRKAADVATRDAIQSRTSGALVLGGDTLASCAGQILGKPKHRDHAESMLRLLSGRKHEVYSGICVWSVRRGRTIVEAVCTKLEMSPLDDDMINSYLDSGLWEGKAGGFGYQDGNDWISIVDGGSESNVVGLPMERLAELLEQFEQIAENIVVDPRS